MRATLAHRGRHLRPGELVGRLDRCPVCGHEGRRRSVLRLQRDPDVHLLRCARCLACSASHMPTARFLDDYYASYQDGRPEGVTFSGIDRLAARLAKGIPPPAGSPRLLDFGGGRGALARALVRLWADGRRLRAEIDVVDHGDSFETIDGDVIVRRRRDLGDVARAYDVVVASAVLEHVPDLASVLPALLASARPGGYFYGRTPWIVPFMRLPLGIDFGFPAHVHDLGHPFWSRVPALFGSPGRLVWSRPSPTATQWSKAPLRTLGAALLKLPGRLFAALGGGAPRRSGWPWVGGWEVLVRRES